MSRSTAGKEALNEWLQRHAFHARGQGARTYVLIDDRSKVVVGYFAIAPHMVAREELPARGWPRGSEPDPSDLAG